MMAESLPDELYLLIFRYLHKFDVIYSFANLNQRFQQIIEPYLREIDLAINDGDTISYEYFHLFSERILPLNGQNIRSLTLTHYQQLRLLEPHIHRFFNLESLLISCKIEQKSNFLQKTLSSLSSLSKLSISSAAPDDILKTISSYTQHRLNTVILFYWKGLKTLDNNVLQMPSIKHLSVNVQLIGILVKLFEIMPNLEELCLSVVEFTGMEKIPSVINIPSTLEKLHLEVGSYDYYSWQNPYNPKLKQIKQFIDLFKNQIRSLTLIAINVDDKDFSNFDKFQNLIENFTRLEKFEYHFNTIHQPESGFPMVQRLLDSTYSIYTLPKPLSLDTTSMRAQFDFDLYRDLTLQELFNCQILKIDSNGGHPPTTFQLTRDSKLVNLQTISLEDPIEDIYQIHPEIREYLKKIISLSPNLTSLKIRIAREGTRSVIQRMYEMFVQNNGKQIKYLYLPIVSADDKKGYPFPELFSHLSLIFPNLRKLDLYVEQKQLNDCYESIAEFIEETKETFNKLIHLTLGMWLRDECDRNGFEAYKANLNELSDSLYYSAVLSHDTFYYLDIWL